MYTVTTFRYRYGPFQLFERAKAWALKELGGEVDWWICPPAQEADFK